MSTTEEHTETTEAPERALLVREFNAELSEGDGRTIDMRIVPYGERAVVNDGSGEYEEEFLPGAFDKQLRAGNRLKVWLNFQHERGISSIVGKGVSLREDADGLYGTFRALEHSDGEKALTLIREGMLDSVSLEFLPKKSIRTAAGVIQRVKAHLDAVALCRQGAYKSALVLSVREAPEPVDEEFLPIDMDPELVERCRRLGITLPQRYQAHPDETDTPDETGTPETAPASTDND